MDRWLFAFLLGSIFSLFLPIVPAIFHVFAFLFLAGCCFWVKSVRFLTAFFLGISWLLLAAATESEQLTVIENLLPDIFDKQVEVIGKVNNIPQINDNAARFNFSIEQVAGDLLKAPINIRLRWYKSCNKEKPKPLCSEKFSAIKQGQQWQLSVKLKPRHGFANPGGFSYQSWLRQQGIIATGYVYKDLAQGLDLTVSYRQTLFERNKALLPDSPLSPLILALTFGERGELTAELWQTLTIMGTQHLIAISGLHIGLVATMSYFLVLWLIRLFPLAYVFPKFCYNSLVQLNNRYLAIIFSLLMAFFYGYLAGFSLPTIRALIMLGIFWGANIYGIKLSLPRLLLLTVFVVVIFMPLSLLSISFWLSFLAVTVIFTIFWLYRSYVDFKSILVRFFASLFLLQLGLSLAMLPMSIFLNHNVFPLAIMANIVAVPWMSLVTIPLSLFAVISGFISESFAHVIFEFVLISLYWLWQWFDYLSQYSIAQVVVDNLSALFIVITFVIFVVFKLLPLSKELFRQKLMILSVFVLLVVFIGRFYWQDVAKKKQWSVSVLDVGQGLSVVVEQAGHYLVYDVGASYKSGFNLAETVLIPYLNYQGIYHLDKVIISHGDNDHAGGLPYLRQHVSFETVMTSHVFSGVQQPCIEGIKEQWGNLTLEVLSPNVLTGNDNDDSCVVMISDDKYKVLLSGDISKKIEAKLVANYTNNALNATVLVAPHHGSKTSSSSAFIQAVSPELVIFSTGFRNRWKMPNKSVLARYQTAAIPYLNTAETGMVKITFEQEKFSISRYRQDLWSYWFAN